MQNNGVYEQATICVQLTSAEPIRLLLSCVLNPIKKVLVFILPPNLFGNINGKYLLINRFLFVPIMAVFFISTYVRNKVIILKSTANDYTKK
jgi:hypothetical protein